MSSEITQQDSFKRFFLDIKDFDLEDSNEKLELIHNKGEIFVKLKSDDFDNNLKDLKKKLINNQLQSNDNLIENSLLIDTANKYGLPLIHQQNYFNITPTEDINKNNNDFISGVPHLHFYFLLIIIFFLLVIVVILIFIVIKVFRMIEKRNKDYLELVSNSKKSEKKDKSPLTKNLKISDKIDDFFKSFDEMDKISTKSKKSDHSKISNFLNHENEDIFNKRKLSENNNIKENKNNNNYDDKKLLFQGKKKEFLKPTINSNKKNSFIMKKLSSEFLKEIIQKGKTAKIEIKKQKKKNSLIFYENKKFENCFTEKQEIGEGSFGVVYKAIHKLEGYIYAIKKITISLPLNKDIRDLPIFREIATMVNLNHKNIVRFITSWAEKEDQNLKRSRSRSEIGDSIFEHHQKSFDDSNLEIIFESENVIESLRDNSSEVFVHKEDINLFIQMEFCEGKSLNTYMMHKEIKVEQKFAFLIFSEILNGLNYIHSKGIIHRDLKPANIFIKKGEIKIGDFGLARIIPESYELLNTQLNMKKDKTRKSVYNRNMHISSQVGTPLYNAPEQEKTNNYNNKADVYSVGLILFEILSNFKTLKEKVEEIRYVRMTQQLKKEFIDNFPVQSEIILKLVRDNSKERPSVKEIFNMNAYKLWKSQIENKFK